MLDTRTVAVMVVLMVAANCLVQLVNWRLHPRLSGGGSWFAGGTLQMLGVLLLLLRGRAPDLLSIVGANALLLGGMMLMIQGTARFAGVRVQRWVFALALIGLFVGFGWFTYGEPSLLGRWWVFGVCTALTMTQSLRAQWRVARDDGWLGVAPYGASSVGVVIVMLGTPAMLTVHHASVERLFEDSLVISWGLALFAVLLTMQAFGRVLMTANRIQGDLERLALMDGLTSLPNRRAFDDALQRAAAKAARAQGPLGLLLLDIDHFKRINDNHGHPEGDAVLRQVAERLAGACRHDDFPARVGGEEFAVILQSPSEATLREVAERVRRAMADTPMVVGGQPQTITVSVGAARRTLMRMEGQQGLYASADAALYAAKQAGRNRVDVALAS